MHARWDQEVGSPLPGPPAPMLVDGLFGTGLTRPLERGIAPLSSPSLWPPPASAWRSTCRRGLPPTMVPISASRAGSARRWRWRARARPCAGCRAGAVRPCPVRRYRHSRGERLAQRLAPSSRRARRARAHNIAAVWSSWSKATCPVPPASLPVPPWQEGPATRCWPAPAMAAVDPDALVRQRIANGDDLADFLTENRIGAVVIGPGLGRDRRAEGLLKAALNANLPLVLDGDALTLLGKSAAAWLQRRTAATWLLRILASSIACSNMKAARSIKLL